jgi:hypothetical protein
MVRSRMFYSSVLVMFIGLYGSSCKGAERNATARDTNILARSDRSFSIETGKAFYQTVVATTGEKVKKDKKILLLLDDPRIGQGPDGVYEVYVCREKCDINMLLPSHPGFVNVLDLYSLTVTEPPKHLLIDLTRKTVELVKKGQPFSSLYVTVLFRGNLLPGNVESKAAGQMTIMGMRVVQEK